MKILDFIGSVRERMRPITYVDWQEVPDGPECPYHARLAVAEELGPTGTEVRAREVVRGTVETVYVVRCPCGRRWFNPRFENVQVCPRCGMAVLLFPPETSGA